MNAQVKAVKLNSKNVESFVNNAIDNATLALAERAVNCSEEQERKVSINIESRLRQADVFKKADSKALLLIAKHSDSNTLAELTNYQNYKTANRILQVSCFLTDCAMSSATRQNISLIKSEVEKLCASDSATFQNIEARTKITASMLKNFIKALQLLKVIERSDKQSIKATIRADTRYILASDSK